MNIGDVVHLVSGSPRMTVTGYTPGGMITASWVAYNTGVPHNITAYPNCFTLEAPARLGSNKAHSRYQDEDPF